MSVETRVFDVIPETGITKLFHYDHADDRVYIETVQTLDDRDELNQAEFNGAESNWKGDMHRVASIPMVIYTKLCEEGIAHDPVALRQWLNDRDNLAFRTKPGYV